MKFGQHSNKEKTQRNDKMISSSLCLVTLGDTQKRQTEKKDQTTERHIKVCVYACVCQCVYV